MGKQINYYMDYESFRLLAEKALSLGCEIIRDHDGTIVRGYSVDLVTEDCFRYYFHVPEAGNIATEERYGKTYVKRGYSASGASIIEAGYSRIKPEEKVIKRERLFVISDYFDDAGNLIKRPDCVTKIYDSLARYAKKLAPSTEVTHRVANPAYEGEKYVSKEYITKECLSIVKDDFEFMI
jgi:hypothetical protein